MKEWTVRQLLDYLNNLTEEQKDYIVSLQGCDCDGACKGAMICEDWTRKTVLLTRE